MNKLLYVYEERIPQELRNIVINKFPTDEFVIEMMTYNDSDEEKKRKMAEADFVLFAPGRFVSDDILQHAKNVKLMQLWSSGYDKFNVEGAKKFGIPVANNGGANASAVAEHAVLLMLSVYKKIPDSHNRTITGNWKGNSHGLDMFKLEGKTIGIIGFGNIGRYVAKKLKGFDSNVVYYDINKADEMTEKDLGVQFMKLEDLLSKSDIVSLHLHANDNTKNIIGDRELSLMKKNSVLINVSRAQLVDQEALIKKMEDGYLLGLGMDVYMKEPTSGNEQLLKFSNIVATPHMAGSTRDTYEFVMDRILENFRRVAEGQKAKWLIY